MRQPSGRRPVNRIGATGSTLGCREKVTLAALLPVSPGNLEKVAMVAGQGASQETDRRSTDRTDKAESTESQHQLSRCHPGLANPRQGNGVQRQVCTAQ